MIDPLLVTLRIDDDASSRFERERRAWYPAERNRVPAHVMLFHHLPGEQIEAVSADLTAVTGKRAPFLLAVTGLRSLGSGVAYVLESPPAIDLRSALAARWQTWLIAQDRERFRPHVVIQNKVDRAQASATQATLGATFRPFSALSVGVDLWRYRGGPWEFVCAFPFVESSPPDGDR